MDETRIDYYIQIKIGSELSRPQPVNLFQSGQKRNSGKVMASAFWLRIDFFVLATLIKIIQPIANFTLDNWCFGRRKS